MDRDTPRAAFTKMEKPDGVFAAPKRTIYTALADRPEASEPAGRATT